MISDRRADLVLAGLGAATPVGRSAWSSAAAVRAGLTGFTQHPVMADVEGRPVLVALCSWLGGDVRVATRIALLLADAIREAIAPLVETRFSTKPRVALLLNLPLPRPGLPADLQDRVGRLLKAEFPDVFESVAVAQRGHAGALMALKSAAGRVASNGADICIVAGADSYMDLETLEWLEETEQLHGAGAANNAWGFVPGEAAAAVLVGTRATFAAARVEVFAGVGPVGVALEPNVIRSGSVCLGDGLTAAFRQALAHDSTLVISDMYCDMNGEPYRADEYGLTITRTRERFLAPSEFVTPADCWGDTGAASAVLSLILAAIALRKGYARGDGCLVWASSDTGERAAATIFPG